MHGEAAGVEKVAVCASLARNFDDMYELVGWIVEWWAGYAGDTAKHFEPSNPTAARRMEKETRAVNL